MSKEPCGSRKKTCHRMQTLYKYLSLINKKQLLEDHLSLAEVIALEYANIPRCDLSEAISEAYQAVDRALNAYDPQKGDFTPFAA
jgi:hypothetical protein